jgi:hypothetical protein
MRQIGTPVTLANLGCGCGHPIHQHYVPAMLMTGLRDYSLSGGRCFVKGCDCKELHAAEDQSANLVNIDEAVREIEASCEK